MAILYEETISAHRSIYTVNAKERYLRLQYSIPEKGTNLETGISFLLPAYGGSLDSSVYRKMRMQFPDRYNLIVIQCDYFGIDYMQTMAARIEEFLEKGKELGTPDEITIQLEETLNNCNDMGIMQASDVLRAGLYVIHKLSSLGIKMNFGKIIAYGSSHGSYLGYLVNRLCPGLIKLVIDNSSYCLPSYLLDERPIYFGLTEELTKKYDIAKCTVYVNYLANRERKQFLPDAFYKLQSLYWDFNNECMILSFHGADDKMVSITEKRELIASIERASLIEVSKETADGRYFKDSVHGLGVDLLNLYEAVDSLTKDIFTYKDSLSIPANVLIERDGHKLCVSYEGLKPHITWIKTEETNVK